LNIDELLKELFALSIRHREVSEEIAGKIKDIVVEVTNLKSKEE
jgi:hypothetical protein